MTGGVVLESASGHDLDQREMFYMYLSPGDIQCEKVCTITSNFVGVLPVFSIYICVCVCRGGMYVY